VNHYLYEVPGGKYHPKKRAQGRVFGGLINKEGLPGVESNSRNWGFVTRPVQKQKKKRKNDRQIEGDDWRGE